MYRTADLAFTSEEIRDWPTPKIEYFIRVFDYLISYFLVAHGPDPDRPVNWMAWINRYDMLKEENKIRQGVYCKSATKGIRQQEQQEEGT